MSKYKLIKPYPGSHPVGSISKLDYSEFPEFWEKIEEVDYKILSFKNIHSKLLVELHNDNLYCNKAAYLYENKGEHSEEECLNKEELVVHSVKRLSDGEVFTVGDLIDFGDFGNKGNQPIEKFEIDYFDKTRITAWGGAFGLGLDRWKTAPVKTPLFTTEDQVDIFIGDKFYVVETRFNLYKLHETVGGHFSKDKPTFKRFHSKEKAEEFIWLNKACLSVTDLLNIQNKYKSVGNIQIIFEAILLVQQKL